jgi:multidrug efflux pump subunit AcrA (membrane-fusion protein)
MNLNRIILATILAVIGPGPSPHEPRIPSLPEPKFVEEAQPAKEKLDAIDVAGCRIIPFESVEIVPQVPGVLKSVKVDIGDRVRKGDVLAEIESPELLADLETARIAVALARARIDQQKLLLQKAEAERRIGELIVQQREADLLTVKAELVRAEEEFSRYAQPSKDAAAKVDVARANVEAAKIVVELAMAEKDARLAAAKSAVQAAKIEDLQHKLAQVGEQKARTLVERTQLLATFDGVVTARNFDAGAVLSAKNTTPIMKVSRTDVMRLVIHLPAAEAAQVAGGARVVATVKTLPADKFIGAVTRIAPAIDEKTGTRRIEVDLPNANGRLLEGMTADVRIELAPAK